MHAQTWARVNAPVDSGVAPLVEALGRFKRLQTLESCETGGVFGGPWVCFWYGAYWESPWRDLSEFVLGYLGPALAEQMRGDAKLSLSVTSAGRIHGELEVRPGAVEATARALVQLASDGEH